MQQWSHCATDVASSPTSLQKTLLNHRSIEKKYLFFLKVAEEFELEGYIVEDFYDWVAEPLLPIFQRLSSLQPVPNTLEAFLFPESQSFTLRADGESLVAIPHDEQELDCPLFCVTLPEGMLAPWPCFEPSAIQLCESSTADPHPSLPAKVLLPDGNIAFLKLMRPGDKGFLVHELAAYSKIRDATLDGSLRISRLLGLVRSKYGTVFGLILTYIDCGRRTLSCALRRGTEAAVRRTWATQIEDTITRIHREGIVWGDAKPDNVLIEHENNSWLIDFGGSYTEGWVPKERAGTTEGDLVALAKIKHSIEAASVEEN